MYIPEHFRMESSSILHFVKDNPFGILVSNVDGKMEATHLPLLVSSDQKFLIGHFAKPNPQKNSLNQEVLCIFPGPHSYISPSWYETNRSVPTWNFTAVHIKGILTYMEDPQEIQNSLKTLVQTFESHDSSYKLSEVDKDYLIGLEKGIVPFRIQITELEGKEKLSQNHTRDRRLRVIENLERMPGENEKAIAKLMKQSLDQNS
ncbi:FMN-binding negative transcriptional regulator [Leptospira levettii]|uniref:FMN-binding negative transcriptional regulator n=1 Tax=Leptospira levettii TaxID=2023178 RepID=A0AAW5V8Q3_9LEPT|nr:FMN-binding negative transcriptional regulator [Leptospira levettii]MCW7465101.1 FMN-binding negative transcriptional regulator [Leptospira levettii]MCW7509841.1 FMN-binding negative transcriptional regulator [Leptospira levettii]MCW7513591.1 FMN-binding negative transcriptional regulator [Leptospira levettii]TGL15872.1 FMN-binding negative transcriptional regulator [Leptospira levettii]TGM27656.1 FMN-binding negative transcriptional regulator [Leptospira levettii]